MPTRDAEAVWNGDLKNGQGTVKLGSGAWEGPYSFTSRFESGSGTNPEELIAAAHAGCFSMATAFQLAGAGFPPEELRTEAQITLTSGASGWSINAIKLVLRAKVSGIDDAKFQELANAAKEGCPVSRALSVPITLDAQLER